MEELEAGEVEYEMTEEFLSSLKKEFRGGEEESVCHKLHSACISTTSGLIFTN